MVTKRLFGYLKDGRSVFCYKIRNGHGEYAEILDYGASIHAVVVRDKYGYLGDVVLGAENADSLETCTYEGATIGRCANRIAYGRYEVDGRQYQLEQNLFGHFLHGASGNYAHKLFAGEITGANQVTLRLHDEGEGGFACCAEAAFTFSFDDEGKLFLSFEMEGEDVTVLNPTNHAYFNLSGNQDARDHLLWIDADRRASRGEGGLPDGGGISVAGTPADFTRERSIREAMESGQEGYFKKAIPYYDEFYLLGERRMRLAAALRSPKKGRLMKVYTDMPCLVLFIGGDRKPEKGKNGQVYEGYCAVCLETGFVPNAVNCPAYTSPIFRKGDKLIARTIYQFMLEDCGN